MYSAVRGTCSGDRPIYPKEALMGLEDDIGNKAQDLAGRGKEAAGAAMDDDSLKNEGKADQFKAAVKDKVENAKDRIEGKIDDLG